jgi:hypothetical protein
MRSIVNMFVGEKLCVFCVKRWKTYAVYWPELLSTVRVGTSCGLKQTVTGDTAVESMLHSAP